MKKPVKILSSAFFLFSPRIKAFLPNKHGPTVSFAVHLHHQTTTNMISKLLIAILITSSVHLKHVVNTLQNGHHLKPSTSKLI